jgi:transposase
VDFSDGAGQRPALLLTCERDAPELVGMSSADVIALDLARWFAGRREPSLDAVDLGTRTKLINNVRGWMRTQLWKLRGGTMGTFAERVRGHAASLGEGEGRRQTAPDPRWRALGVSRADDGAGIGPVTALRFVATMDEPGRFVTAHRVQSYLGLTPGEHSSAERERRTGISKAGPMELRRTLIQAAWAAMCFVRTSHPMIEWARRLAERRG